MLEIEKHVKVNRVGWYDWTVAETLQNALHTVHIEKHD